MSPVLAHSMLALLVMTGATDGPVREESQRRPSAEVYQEAQEFLKSQGMVLDGPRAPQTAGASAEVLVREIVKQLQAKNMRGVLSLLWKSEGVACSQAEDEARRRVAEECATNLGRLTVYGVATDAKLKQVEAVKVKTGSRIEGCTAKGVTAIERWTITSGKERHTVVVIHTGASGWKLVRFEGDAGK